MKRIRCFLSFCLIFALSVCALHAVGNSSAGSLISPAVWELLRDAEFALDAGDTGTALVLSEKARDLHRSEIETMSADLKRAVSSREVKKAGDGIASVYQILSSRRDSAKDVLDAIFAKYEPSAFSNSISALIAWLEDASAFPEADVFAGRVYEAEGEYAQAIAFYKRAWEDRSYFDVPGDSVTLAYHIADLSRLAGNQRDFGDFLLIALEKDPVYGTVGRETPALLAMIRTAKEDVLGRQGSFSGVRESSSAISPAFVKFFSLYRNDNPSALKAYQDLTDFFYASGKRLEPAMGTGVLSAVTAFTLLENAVREYEFEYTYTSFSDTLRAAARHPEITDWASQVRIWDSFLQFADVLFDSGARDFASALWMNLSMFCPDEVACGKAAACMNRAFRPIE